MNKKLHNYSSQWLKLGRIFCAKKNRSSSLNPKPKSRKWKWKVLRWKSSTWCRSRQLYRNKKKSWTSTSPLIKNDLNLTNIKWYPLISWVVWWRSLQPWKKTSRFKNRLAKEKSRTNWSNSSSRSVLTMNSKLTSNLCKRRLTKPNKRFPKSQVNWTQFRFRTQIWCRLSWDKQPSQNKENLILKSSKRFSKIRKIFQQSQWTSNKTYGRNLIPFNLQRPVKINQKSTLTDSMFTYFSIFKNIELFFSNSIKIIIVS